MPAKISRLQAPAVFSVRLGGVLVERLQGTKTPVGNQMFHVALDKDQAGVVQISNSHVLTASPASNLEFQAREDSSGVLLVEGPEHTLPTFRIQQMAPDIRVPAGSDWLVYANGLSILDSKGIQAEKVVLRFEKDIPEDLRDAAVYLPGGVKIGLDRGSEFPHRITTVAFLGDSTEIQVSVVPTSGGFSPDIQLAFQVSFVNNKTRFLFNAKTKGLKGTATFSNDPKDSLFGSRPLLSIYGLRELGGHPRSSLKGFFEDLSIDSSQMRGQFTCGLWESRDSTRPKLSAFIPVIKPGEEVDPSIVLRPYSGEIISSFGPDITLQELPEVFHDVMPSGYTSLTKKEVWVNFKGEISNVNLMDSLGGPLTLYSEKMVMFHPREVVGANPTAPAFAANEAFFLSQKLELGENKILPALAYGDVHLTPIMGKGDLENPCASFFTSTYPDQKTKKGLWAFRIKQLMKTPFKGDCVATGERGDRQEFYPAKSGVTTLEFDSTGELIANGADDLLEGFRLTGENRIEGVQQPAGAAIRFGQDTALARSTKPVDEGAVWRSIETGKPLQPDTRYIKVDATLELPAVASGGYSLNKYDPIPYFPLDAAKELSNFFVGIDLAGREACDYLLQVTTVAGKPRLNIPIGFGWRLKHPEGREACQVGGETPIVKIHLKKNLETESSPQTQLIGVQSPAVVVSEKLGAFQFQVRDVNGIRMGESRSYASEEWKEWEYILRDESSPTKSNWSGVLFSEVGFDVSLIPLPDSIKFMIEKVIKATIAWVDGYGATVWAEVSEATEDHHRVWVLDAASLSNPPKSYSLGEVRNPDHGELKGKQLLVLTGFKFLVSKNEIEKFSLKLMWTMPFFDQAKNESEKNVRQFIEIQGSVASSSGQAGSELVLVATIPNEPIHVGWLGVNTLKLRKIGIRSAGKDDHGKEQWKLTLDGTVQFDQVDGNLKEWFKGKLESLDFSGWELDFQNPLKDWNFPGLKLNNPLKLKVLEGFGFQLDSFGIPKPGAEFFRAINLIGKLDIGSVKFPFGDWQIDTNIQLAIRDFTELPAIKFVPGVAWLKGIEFNLFKFLQVKISDAFWEEERKVFGAKVKLSCSWFENGQALELVFVMGTHAGESFWVIGEPNGRSVDLGAIKMTNPSLVIGHRAGFDGLQDAIVHSDDEAVRDLLVSLGGDGKLSRWKFSPEYEWLIGIYSKEVEIAQGLFEGKEFILILCDDDAFRLSGNITILGFALGDVKIAINWRKQYMEASIRPNLPDLFKYGAYKVLPPTIGLGYGKGSIKGTIGFPENGDWSRALSIIWDPPAGAIPVNKIDGGFLARVDYPYGFSFAVALRAGYEKVLGSDGGAFGAYLGGRYGFGGIIGVTVGKGGLIGKGVLTFDADAKGGVIVFGLRWDVFSVYVHAGIVYMLGVYNGRMVTDWGANFSAGFKVCITPCTCISGNCNFSQGMSESQGTDYSPPDKSLSFLSLDIDTQGQIDDLARLYEALLAAT